MTLGAIESFTPLSIPPDDFDSFWAKTRKEINDVEPRPSVERLDAPAPGLVYEKIEFLSLNGARIAG